MTDKEKALREALNLMDSVDTLRWSIETDYKDLQRSLSMWIPDIEEKLQALKDLQTPQPE